MRKFYIQKLIFLMLFLGLFSPYKSSEIYTFHDSQEDVRQNFIDRYSEKISKGKVSFHNLDNNKGRSCVANEDLYQSESTLFIPRDFIICGFDIFPYRNEVNESIMSALKDYETLKKVPLFNPLKVESYLQAFQLLFYSYSEKTNIWAELEKNGLNHYIYAPKIQAMNYLETLPEILYSYHVYTEAEKDLVSSLGLNYDFNESKYIFNKVITLLKFKLKKNQVRNFMVWANNYKKFMYYLGIIDSRSIKVSLVDYEVLYGMSLRQIQKGNKLTREDQDSNRRASCLVPFLDFCNHKSGNDLLGRNYIKSGINFKTGYVTVSVSQSFSKGEEYVYSYFPQAQKDVFLFNFGFYDESPQSLYVISFGIDKTEFTFQKYSVCKKVKCIKDMEIDFFFTNPNLQSVVIDFKLNQVKLNFHLLNLMRLLAIPSGEIIDPEKLKIQLSSKQPISYRNDMVAHALVRKVLNETIIGKSPYKTDTVIFIVQYTKNYYEAELHQLTKLVYKGTAAKTQDKKIKCDQIKSCSETNSHPQANINVQAVTNALKKLKEIQRTYKLRNQIFKLSLEFRRIVLKNQLLVTKNFLKMLSSQFIKIKHFYVIDEDEVKSAT